MPPSGVRISDIIASGKTGLTAYNTDALELHNIQVNADGGPAFLIKDSTNLELDGVTSRKPVAGVPVVRLDRCPGAIVRSSKAFGGTGTFLAVGLGELKSLFLEGNVLGAAQKATEEVAHNYWPAESESK